MTRYRLEDDRPRRRRVDRRPVRALEEDRLIEIGADHEVIELINLLLTALRRSQSLRQIRERTDR